MSRGKTVRIGDLSKESLYLILFLYRNIVLRRFFREDLKYYLSKSTDPGHEKNFD